MCDVVRCVFFLSLCDAAVCCCRCSLFVVCCAMRDVHCLVLVRRLMFVVVRLLWSVIGCCASFVVVGCLLLSVVCWLRAVGVCCVRIVV